MAPACCGVISVARCFTVTLIPVCIIRRAVRCIDMCRYVLKARSDWEVGAWDNGARKTSVELDNVHARAVRTACYRRSPHFVSLLFIFVAFITSVIRLFSGFVSRQKTRAPSLLEIFLYLGWNVFHHMISRIFMVFVSQRHGNERSEHSCAVLA
ncbi:unnamed protein product [Sphacelaria rigidula]